MKAISKFKSLLTPKGVVEKPYQPTPITKNHQQESQDQPPPQQDTTTTSQKAQATADHATKIISDRERFFSETRAARNTATGTSTSSGEKGHAHTLSSADVPFLGIGTGGKDDFILPSSPSSTNIVSESPTAVDFNVYDRAFEAEVDKIKRSTSRRDRKGTTGALYKTKHLKEVEKFFKDDEDVVWVGEEGAEGGGGARGIGEKFRMFAPRSGPKFADLVSQTVRDARRMGEEVVGVGRGDDGEGKEKEKENRRDGEEEES